jgi:hypothetical protein
MTAHSRAKTAEVSPAHSLGEAGDRRYRLSASAGVRHAEATASRENAGNLWTSGGEMSWPLASGIDPILRRER